MSDEAGSVPGGREQGRPRRASSLTPQQLALSIAAGLVSVLLADSVTLGALVLSAACTVLVAFLTAPGRHHGRRMVAVGVVILLYHAARKALAAARPDRATAQPASAQGGSVSLASVTPASWSAVAVVAAAGCFVGVGGGAIVRAGSDSANGLSVPRDVRAKLGAGDVEVTLVWAGNADVDLHVVDPRGDEIHFDIPSSASGGQLDHDDRAACDGNLADTHVEHVFWPTGRAPAGRYRAWAQLYELCGVRPPVAFELSVKVDGKDVPDAGREGTLADVGSSSSTAQFRR